MSQTDIVILGGSAAGITAAITARRHYRTKSICLVRREEQVLIPCGIPYIFGTLGSPDANLIPDAILQKNDIELRIAEATALDRKANVLKTSEGDIRYDRLILATGSEPVRPPIAGIEKEGVFEIRKNIAYLRKLQEQLKDARDVVIIGCGFIGIEFADEINKRGDKRISIVEIAPCCLSLAYDTEFCTEMEAVLKERGIALHTASRVTAIEGNGRVTAVNVENQSPIKADVVILGIGARSNVGLAKEAGLRLGATGSIAVDRTMRTSDPAIFACGDCTEKISFFGGRPSMLKLASIAEMEARIAGANLFGIRRESQGTLGVWSTAVGDFAMATAGLTEGMAKENGYQAVSAGIEGPNRHPGSMPGAARTLLKLVFEANSQVVLGGQILGSDTVGEMINIVAACVQKRMTAEDIATFQMGTHPALTASPIAYHLVNAAELALAKMGNEQA